MRNLAPWTRLESLGKIQEAPDCNLRIGRAAIALNIGVNTKEGRRRLKERGLEHVQQTFGESPSAAQRVLRQAALAMTRPLPELTDASGNHIERSRRPSYDLIKYLGHTVGLAEIQPHQVVFPTEGSLLRRALRTQISAAQSKSESMMDIEPALGDYVQAWVVRPPTLRPEEFDESAILKEAYQQLLGKISEDTRATGNPWTFHRSSSDPSDPHGLVLRASGFISKADVSYDTVEPGLRVISNTLFVHTAIDLTASASRI